MHGQRLDPHRTLNFTITCFPVAHAAHLTTQPTTQTAKTCTHHGPTSVQPQLPKPAPITDLRLFRHNCQNLHQSGTYVCSATTAKTCTSQGPTSVQPNCQNLHPSGTYVCSAQLPKPAPIRNLRLFSPNCQNLHPPDHAVMTWTSSYSKLNRC